MYALTVRAIDTEQGNVWLQALHRPQPAPTCSSSGWQLAAAAADDLPAL